MVTVLAVADETVAALPGGGAAEMRPDLLLSAGDLPFDYLESLVDACDVPLVFVPGNHDRDLTRYRRTRSGWTYAGLPCENPGPGGGVNADGRVVTVAGLTIAGLGGSIRHNAGPNQYTDRQFAGRARRVRWHGRRARVDLLLTHSPARGLGDAEDPCHRGFTALAPLVRKLRPQALVHGHIHPHGQVPSDRTIPLPVGRDAAALGATVSINTVGYCLFDIEPGGTGITITRRRHGG